MADQTNLKDIKGLAQPAIRALTGAGHTRLELLTSLTEAELMALHGMGPKALSLLREELAKRGLEFRQP